MRYEITFSILCYDEEDHRVAHCLEMDLKGRGKDDQEALGELAEMILLQVTFAAEKGEPGLLDHPADPKLFRKFRDLQKKRISQYPKQVKTGEYSSFCIPMPKPDRTGMCLQQEVF